MTYTAGQLREWAKEWDNDGGFSVAEVFRAHADALEELAQVRRDMQRMAEEMATKMAAPAHARANRAEAALAECRARLEIDFATDGSGKRVPVPAGAPDGIACRDETIRLLEAALAERDAEIKALNGHAERFMVEREGNSRQFARLQERLAKAEADCDAYLDDATRYSRHLKGAWMDSGDERDFYVWRDEAVQVDDAWWDKEGPSINAAIDASRKPS